MLATDLKPSANLNAAHGDYETVRQVLEHITENWRDQPELDELSRLTGVEPTRLQKTFTRWAGLSPKAFLQAVTLDHAKRMLHDGMPILDASLELGLSGPGRLHDLFVTHEAMSPGVYKAGGEGITIHCGFHDSPFGEALIMATDRGLTGLAFADAEGAVTAGRHDGEKAQFTRARALADMRERWPKAKYVEDVAFTAPFAARIFDPARWRAQEPLKIVFIGTDFQIRVWEGLLKVPLGQATTYSSLAQDLGKPSAARAVGAAVGRNPISFVVPCHRVLGKSGRLTGYHWGLTRKRAMLGWEAGIVGTAA
ncbi:MAG: bifunctional helix-turn-helix domain-containing protein/methylated-DNA--[protein]-cysteine S-methyltransferase [Ahrensia sp.]|nr:bifunctional helix-turn-helix domain-containing protein/methylated-DNA--[protein]-cysteine S-methyltransferase [Ahrensia sp.]